MKKLIALIVVMMLWVGVAYSAELLVRASPHYMDKFTQDKIDALENKDSFNARSQIGDIIVVKPDGWVWGKEECLPNFIVIQVPDMTLEEAKIYEETLMADDGVDTEGLPKQKMLKHRMYNVEKEVIDIAKAESKSKIIKVKLVIKPKIIKKDK